MPLVRALVPIVCIVAAIAGIARPALAQVCSHNGPLVNCDDGRRGLLSGDLIIWADGTRSNASPPPSVVIGNKVGKGSGVAPPDDPNKTRCAVLDGVPYCY
jgi:hypothetical protein